MLQDSGSSNRARNSVMGEELEICVVDGISRMVVEDVRRLNAT